MNQDITARLDTYPSYYVVMDRTGSNMLEVVSGDELLEEDVFAIQIKFLTRDEAIRWIKGDEHDQS